VNPLLVKAIAKSYYWNKLLLSGEVKNIKDIKRRENQNGHKYVHNILELKYLASHL
jgi:hypothetical protein